MLIYICICFYFPPIYPFVDRYVLSLVTILNGIQEVYWRSLYTEWMGRGFTWSEYSLVRMKSTKVLDCGSTNSYNVYVCYDRTNRLVVPTCIHSWLWTETRKPLGFSWQRGRHCGTYSPVRPKKTEKFLSKKINTYARKTGKIYLIIIICIDLGKFTIYIWISTLLKRKFPNL